jgi:ATP-dependent Lon protease
VVSQYTRESGVRQLEQKVGAVARKLARKIAGKERVPKRIGPKLVRKLLGRPKIRPERANPLDEIGVATGMYYTPTGGDIMFVEASIRRLYDAAGKDRDCVPTGCGPVSLILTGHLGEVMQESARAALTYATARAGELDVPDELMGALEVHVHVPAGAVPKDGPSAGVAMAVGLVSALTRRPVRREAAMTGEITLRGRVLPIGGIKEKVLGAHRAGISQVILPAENADDLDEIPDDVREQLTFHPVQTLDEVIQLTLLEPESAEAFEAA